MSVAKVSLFCKIEVTVKPVNADRFFLDRFCQKKFVACLALTASGINTLSAEGGSGFIPPSASRRVRGLGQSPIYQIMP